MILGLLKILKPLPAFGACASVLLGLGFKD